jgi:hypothetical protein
MTKPLRCSNVFILLDGNFLQATLWQRHSRYQVATLAKLPSHYVAAMLFVYFMATSCRQRLGVFATTLPGGNVAMTKWRLIGNVAVWSCVSWVGREYVLLNISQIRLFSAYFLPFTSRIMFG